MFEHLSWLSVPHSVLLAGEGGVTEIIIDLLIQLAVILLAAKISGELASRYLKLPPVLAELGAGVLIGPFALGAIPIPGFGGPLFPIPLVDGVRASIPVSTELFSLAQIGSVFLLFAIGLETNLRQFLRYAGPATAVALGRTFISTSRVPLDFCRRHRRRRLRFGRKIWS